jgi:hypothetical protein
MKIYKNKKSNYDIYAGVNVDAYGNVTFDWEMDNPDTDILKLAENTSGEFNDEGIRYVYGYQYNSKAGKDDKRIFRNYIKGLKNIGALYGENIDDFVEEGVFRLERCCGLSDFGAIVSIESAKSMSIINVMDSYISEYVKSPFFDFKLVKRTYDHVEFDSIKAAQALRDIGWRESRIYKEMGFITNKFNELKESGDLFEMKRFTPKEIRCAFTDFLRFNSDSEREVYETLQGVDVLIYDDFLTSGATVKEIIRYLKAINDRNTLTVFVLVKQ